MPDRDPSGQHIELCSQCYEVARSQDGRIMGYKMKDGKIVQYVKEELF